MKPLLLIAFLSFFGKEPSDTGIHYRTLRWQDFRRPAPRDSIDIAAVTTAELIFDYRDNNGICKFKVTAVFLPDLSWVRIKNDYLLRHEQTHFKIAYLMALKCNRDIAPLQGLGEDAEKQAETIYNQYFQAMNAMNIQFDQESNRSLIKSKEKQWEDRIEQEINQITADGRNHENTEAGSPIHSH